MEIIKRYLWIAIVLVVLFLSACGEKLSQQKQPVHEMNPSDEISYSKKDFPLSGITLNSPRKIASDSESLFICDADNDRIVKCDFEGKNVSVIGALGSMDGELSSPECIAVNKDKICVYDKDNHRIQVFDKKGTFLSKFELKDHFSVLGRIVDIEIDNDDNIYFSLLSHEKHLKESGLYGISSDNDLKLIQPLFVGNLYCDPESNSNEIFYVSRFELVNGNEWQTGYSEFGVISGFRYETKNAFSSLFSSIDLARSADFYFVYDNTTQSVYKFNKTGACESCLFREEVPNIFVYRGFCAAPNQCLYLSDSANHKIYVLTPMK